MTGTPGAPRARPGPVQRSLAQRSLSSHAAIGLLAGALLYLVCLTGTVTVFYEEAGILMSVRLTGATSGDLPALANTLFIQRRVGLPRPGPGLYGCLRSGDQDRCRAAVGRPDGAGPPPWR